MTLNLPLKVLVVDDHATIRVGVKQILSAHKDIQAIDEAENGLEAIKILRKENYALVLLDISLPDRNGIEVLKQIKSENSKLSVLIFSMHREEHYAVRAIKAGAAGYVHKQSSPQELLQAVRQVLAGQKYISPTVAQELARQITENETLLPHETLSDREFQTLMMIASGMNVTEIAKELALSVKTISMYRARILLKMKFRHNAELTYYVLKNNLIE